MSRFKDLSKDKTTIMKRILTSQDICKALKYEDSDFLDQPDIENPASLIGDRIYPYYRVPEAEKDVGTYILLSFRNFRPTKGQAFKSGVIDIYTITHKDLVMTDYGFLRYDHMISEIDELMNSERGIGIGRLEFLNMDEVFVNAAFLGNVISYKPYEFN